MTQITGGGFGNNLRTAGSVKPYGALLSTMGDTIAIAGIPSKKLRLFWVAFVPSLENLTSNLVTIKFESASENLYVGYAMSHWEPFVGATGKGIIVNLANSQSVAVTLHYDIMT